MGRLLPQICFWAYRCTMAGFCPNPSAISRLDTLSCKPRQPLPVNQDLVRVEVSCPHTPEPERFDRLWKHICSLLLVLFIIIGGSTVMAAGRPESGAAAAVVNGTAISREEFRLELDRVRRQQGTKAKLADEAKLAELKREALENLITRELLYQESQRRRVKIDGSAVDRQLKELKGQFADEAQFTKALTKLRMSEDVVRDQVTHGLAIKTLIAEMVGSRIAVTDAEIKDYFDRHGESFAEPPQTRLSHILLLVEPDWTPERKKAARQKMAELQARLKIGEDFSPLAKGHSDCQSKSKGGDIGWFTPGQMAPVVEKAVAPLNPGELSGIVEDRFGLHIIKVTERKSAFTPPFEELKDKIRGLIKQEKGQKELQPLVKKLRDGARVEIVLREDD